MAMCLWVINWNEIMAAIVTSLIASIVFWLVFNVIPNAIDRRKIKPLLDFDLYQIYSKLAFFLEVPLLHSMHSSSFLQMKLYTGQLKKEDFSLYLSTKCLTEEYQQVDDVAKNLMPIGSNLKKYANDIVEMIQKLYIFNKYMPTENILLCRKIADKVTTYDYEMKAFETVGDKVLGPVDPTIRDMSGYFYDTYTLFLKMQEVLIGQKPTSHELGDFYKYLQFRKQGLLYSQGNYKQVIKATKNKNDSFSKAFYFMSLLKIGEMEKGIVALKRYLETDKEKLIYLRGHFNEFTDDSQIKEALIDIRSESEYKEMIDCLRHEYEQQKTFENFALQMQFYYKNKVISHFSGIQEK